MDVIMPQRRKFTSAEYLIIERAADIRSEYLDGELYAMAGASPNHVKIATNLTIEVGAQLKGKSCQAMSHDMKVAAGPDGLFAYPDLLIVCGKEMYLDEVRDVLLNPSVIIEVLSPSTETYDRTVKFERYKLIDTLSDYVLVAQDSATIECHTRAASGEWGHKVLCGLGAALELTSVGVTVNLADIYDRVALA